MKICLTGATGFIGSAIVKSALAQNISLLVLIREGSILNLDVDCLKVDFDHCTSLDIRKIKGCDSFIHCAAYTHAKKGNSSASIDEYRKANRDVTLGLARLAAAAGVRRFVFLSSVKVNGELTHVSRPFVPDFSHIPEDPYGLSKYEAERGLLDIARNTGMEVVIIRPPLVYGPGVKANFASMVSWVRKGIPLPFGAVRNCRSLVSLDNLVDFILLCSNREKSIRAANEIFLVSDGEDISTSSLLCKVAKAYGVKPRLFPIPVSLMKLVAKLLGRKDISDRLFGNLQIDNSKALDLLGWKPTLTMDEQLKKMAEYDLEKVK